MPVKHLDRQAAMYTHLSQLIGAGALDGQHGMSLAISSVISEADMSSAAACIDTSETTGCAMTGRETGANARPAITRVANSLRMAKLRFINPESHKIAANERLQPLHGDENSSYCYPLSAGLCFAAPAHVYDRAGLLFYHRREGSASSFDHPGDFLGCCENHGRAVAHQNGGTMYRLICWRPDLIVLPIAM